MIDFEHGDDPDFKKANEELPYLLKQTTNPPRCPECKSNLSYQINGFDANGSPVDEPLFNCDPCKKYYIASQLL